MQLVLHQTGKLTQTHVHDSLGLDVVQYETVHQVLDGIVWSLGGLDYLDNLIYVIGCNDQAFKYMSAFLGFLQIKLGATDDNFMTVLYETLDEFTQIKAFGTSLDKGNVIYAE
jgi:hypothetical protein